MHVQGSAPLAERMRPQTLDAYVGQEHLLKPGSPLRIALEQDVVPSMILWGPPGVGKTTLAQIIANHTKRPFYTLSAISSGVKDVREVIAKVQNQGLFGGNNAILFIDEIHRFSKAQQDSLLGAVEKGVITLIGATTENPSFEVISALQSRCQVYVLEHLSEAQLKELVLSALQHDSVLGQRKIEVKEWDALLQLSGGDGRKLLNGIEVLIHAQPEEDVCITNEMVKASVQQNFVLYDKTGEQHYDIISAFIKSIRGSDPNGAVYWLARMVEGGEDPKFIARRLIISAAEDIGNANPTALVMANNCFQAIERIGWPEGRIVLSQCAVYLACSAKSNASYAAIGKAQQLVQETGNLPVPLHLRNAPTKLMKDLDYGKDYKYAHSYEQNFVDQNFLPDAVEGTTLYAPGNNPRELEFKKRMAALWRDRYDYG